MHINIFYLSQNIRGNKFSHTGVSRSGSKAEDRERKKERLNDGDNNGQAMHGARKHAWAKILNEGNNNGQLHIANATSGGARKAAWANLI